MDPRTWDGARRRSSSADCPARPRPQRSRRSRCALSCFSSLVSFGAILDVTVAVQRFALGHPDIDHRIGDVQPVATERRMRAPIPWAALILALRHVEGGRDVARIACRDPWREVRLDGLQRRLELPEMRDLAGHQEPQGLRTQGSSVNFSRYS